MTTQEIIDYYADLLIIQYNNAPRAYAHIQTVVSNVIMDQLPIDVQNAFDPSSAVGVQLDTLGKYLGVSRSVYSFQSQIILDDDDFRTLINIAIIKNNFGSSLYEIQELLFQFFPGALLVFDFQTMRMGYFFDAAIGSEELAEVFVRSNFLPKPMGVELAALIYSPNIDSFYGFGTYVLPPYNNTGLNSYIDYDEEAPWLSYANAIV